MAVACLALSSPPSNLAASPGRRSHLSPPSAYRVLSLLFTGSDLVEALTVTALKLSSVTYVVTDGSCQE